MPRIELLSDGSGFHIVLRSGRRLGAAEYGAPGGRPLIWFPGTPGSRLFHPPDEELTRARGVRFIVIERPGFGVSDPQPGRRVIDWSADFRDALDALELERVSLAGTSGAGPFLCACAQHVPDRLRAVALIGVVGPPRSDVMRGFPFWRRGVFALFRRAPWIVRAGMERLIRAKGIEGFYRTLVRDAPPRDRAILARIWGRQIAMTREALRHGVEPFVTETHLGASDWGLDLSTIRVPVFVFQGEDDHAAPRTVAQYFERTIATCKVRYFPGEGHFLHHDHWGEILDAVMS